jgi:hypothetical protein
MFFYDQREGLFNSSPATGKLILLYASTNSKAFFILLKIYI